MTSSRDLPAAASGCSPAAGHTIMAARAALITLFLALVLISAGNANATSGGIAVSTDKLVYHTGDSVVFNLVLDSGGRALTGDLVVRIYPAASLMKPDLFAGQPMSETILQKGFSLSGQGTASAGASLSDLKVGPGGYPFKVSLMSGNEAVVTGTGWLPVVDPAGREPLDLVLLWTAGSPPQRDDQGHFSGTGLIDRCRADPRAPDTLLQHSELAQKFPKIKTTYAVEASLFDQLEDLADGFDLVEGGKVVSVPAGSPESGAANDCLAGFRTLAASSNTEFISAPYFFTSLPLLAKQGWDDGNGQYRIGHDVLTNTLALAAAPRGTYAPGLDVTTDSLRYLAATGGDYTVLPGAARDYIQGRLPAGATSYRIRDLSGERITGFFANDDATAAIFSDTPDASAFFAALANAYTSGGPRLTIAASPSPNPVLAAEQRQRIYATIDQEPWLRSLTLSEAKDKYRPSTQPVTLLRYLDPAAGYLTQTYYQKLDATHERFEDYRAAVDSNIPEMSRLTREMYSAESIYFISSGIRPEAANQGLVYLESIDRFTTSEFGKLEIDVDTPLLQRHADGEATVTLVNNNPYPFTADLTLSGNGVEFPDGSGRQLHLDPGKIEIKVPFRSDGWSNIEARLASRDHTLVEDSAGIHLITSRGWIVILFALAALGGGIGYVYVVNRNR
jgi:hypothetical protein